jgi:hypothetical protein
MKSNPVLLVVCLLLTASVLTAQKGYFSTDTSLTIGVKINIGKDEQNCQYCAVIEKGVVKLMSPYEIIGYGIDNGREFIARDIILNDSSYRVFLERLVNDSTSLYYYKSEGIEIFFIEHNSDGLITLTRNEVDSYNSDYRTKLKEITSSCENTADAALLITYRKPVLTRFAKMYNNCERKAFPFFKYGAYTGAGFSWLVPVEGGNSYFDNPDFEMEFTTSHGLLIGIFIDQPLMVSDFSFHPEIYFTDYSYSSNSIDENTEIDLLVNTSAINLPMMFRYALPTLKARPYINLGGIYTYQWKIKNEGYSTALVDSDYRIVILDKPSPVSQNLAGFTAGAGMEADLTYRMRIYFDIRFSRLYGLGDGNSIYYNQKELLINGGISF